MKKIVIITIAVGAIIGLTICAQNSKNSTTFDRQLQEWEQLAEAGDTAAMHRLIEFYDTNSVEYVEVEAIIDCDGNEVSPEEVDKINDENKNNAEKSKFYSERLDYWVDKGIAINDPIALASKGMRLYYEDELQGILFLSKAAESGNAQAALFCGSACLNQGRGDEAFKYLSMAYKLGAPSAGWHLAMCYSAGIGTRPNREKAIEAMRHAALMDYPEAVSEMRRIEPGEKIWQAKADSLEIDFSDFPIIQ